MVSLIIMLISFVAMLVSFYFYRKEEKRYEATLEEYHRLLDERGLRN